MSAPTGPSTLRYFGGQGNEFQVVERAKILRVLFESDDFDRARSPLTAAATLSVAAVRQLFAPFIGSLPGVAGGIDPLVGVPAPPPQYKLIVSTDISERQIEVPYISLTPGIQFVPREGDYVLVFFLADKQGIAFGHWEQIGPNRSYRQGRLPLQRGDIALMPLNVLRPNATHLIMSSAGVVRLASTDSCYIRMDPFDSRFTQVFRNLRQHSGVHRLQILQGRNLSRSGKLDLEVYESSIARSNTAQQTLGRAADVLRGGIAVCRMGKTGFSKGVQQPPSPILPDFDMWFAGVEEDLTGQIDPDIRTTRRVKSYFSMSRLGEVEVNAGNYQPAELPDVVEGEVAIPLPPDEPPSTIADLKHRASGDIVNEALGDLINRVVGSITQAAAGDFKGKALSFKFTAGNPALPGTFEIDETGKISIYLGEADALSGLFSTSIIIDPTLQSVQVRALGLVVVDAPILQLGLLLPTTVRAGVAGPNVIFDPTGNLIIESPTGDVNVNIVSAGNVNLGGSGSKLMLDSIIDKFNNHTHGGVTAGGDSSGAPNSNTFAASDSSAKAESSS